MRWRPSRARAAGGALEPRRDVRLARLAARRARAAPRLRGRGGHRAAVAARASRARRGDAASFRADPEGARDGGDAFSFARRSLGTRALRARRRLGLASARRVRARRRRRGGAPRWRRGPVEVTLLLLDQERRASREDPPRANPSANAPFSFAKGSIGIGRRAARPGGVRCARRRGRRAPPRRVVSRFSFRAPTRFPPSRARRPRRRSGGWATCFTRRALTCTPRARCSGPWTRTWGEDARRTPRTRSWTRSWDTTVVAFVSSAVAVFETPALPRPPRRGWSTRRTRCVTTAAWMRTSRCLSRRIARSRRYGPPRARLPAGRSCPCRRRAMV